MSKIDGVIAEVRTARLYTKELLRNIEQDVWYRQPTEGVTHVAWQVGHLAVAQYGLALKRVRGEKPEDETLIPGDFRKAFGKGSVPKPDPASNPPAETIVAVFDRVHEEMLRELGELPEAVFDAPSDEPPHPMFKTKLGAVQWCAQHEFIHIGQIALLRRLLGSEPLR